MGIHQALAGAAGEHHLLCTTHGHTSCFAVLLLLHMYCSWNCAHSSGHPTQSALSCT
jgi:hypothetical protein